MKKGEDTYTSIGGMYLHFECDEIIVEALNEASALHTSYIGSEHVLLAILKNSSYPITKVLNGYGIYYQTIKNELYYLEEENFNGYSPVIKEILSQCKNSTDMILYFMKKEDCVAGMLLKQYKIEAVFH